MSLALIVAMADNGAIGANNTLPWRLPEDLKRFKSITMGKPIVMGRKTFDSIGKALPGRQNIVITRHSELRLTDCTVVSSLSAAMQVAGTTDEIMVIGGAEIYQQALPLATRIYLTQVHANVEGDVIFPSLDASWHEVSREDHVADERHVHAYSFVILERVTP